MKKDSIEKRFRETGDQDFTDRSVNQSHVIVRAAQNLTINEKRVIASAIATTDSVPQRALARAMIPDSISSAQGWVVRLLASDFAETYGIDIKNAYKQLKEGGASMFGRYISVVEKGPRGPRVSKIRWISRFTYHDSEGYAELAFSPDIAPYLLGLRANFTSYKLKNVANFKSQYTWRFYELCRSWWNRGRFTMKIEEFEAAMDAPDSCRNNYQNLMNRVILPAVKELEIKSKLAIQIRKIKFQRKIVELEIIFVPIPQAELDFGDDKEPVLSLGDDNNLGGIDEV